MPETGTRATQVGLKVRDLQLQLPKARVVYCSATGASGERPTACHAVAPAVFALHSTAPWLAREQANLKPHSALSAVCPSRHPPTPAPWIPAEPRNMGYMVRLGLWGPGHPAFPAFPAFLEAVQVRRLFVHLF